MTNPQRVVPTAEGLKTSPRARAHDGNTQHVALGRDHMELARHHAATNGYTIRSVIECAIVFYLRAQGEQVPEIKEVNRTKVQVSRDGGQTWKFAGIVNKEERQGSVFIQADDGITYQREAENARSPFRWRWPRLV